MVSEVYFALRHRYQVPEAKILETLEAFLGGGMVKNLGVASQILRTGGAQGDFLERVIHRQYLEAAEQMATFEKSAQRLPKVRVLR